MKGAKFFFYDFERIFTELYKSFLRKVHTSYTHCIVDRWTEECHYNAPHWPQFGLAALGWVGLGWMVL